MYIEVSRGRCQESATAVSEAVAGMENNRSLFADISDRCLEALTVLLIQIAEEENLFNFNSILSSEGLQQIAGWLPRTKSELLTIDTMTEAKVAKYGVRIMQVLEPFWEEMDRRESDRMKDELKTLEKGLRTSASSAASRFVSQTSHFPAEFASQMESYDGFGTCCECLQKGRLNDCFLLIRPEKGPGDGQD
ncbi:unnamed protein product [Soboliphyme baturini]|uniref:HRDC domain-containing protein n=1 Tax=Soboliphyme baturini TaxID=241478 RepID=A0A183IQQ2_9BILA|nr:unnamed protein product [Soboliphyme baturini]